MENSTPTDEEINQFVNAPPVPAQPTSRSAFQPGSFDLNAANARDAALSATEGNAGRSLYQTPPPDAYWIPKPAPEPQRDFRREAIEALRPMLNQIPQSQINAKTVNDAMEMATQLEGSLGFDADRKAGMPMMEALFKWGGKMKAANVSAMSNAQRAAQAAIPFVPQSKMVDGQKMYQKSLHQWGFAPDAGGKIGEVVKVGGQDYARTGPNSLQRLGREPLSNLAKVKLDNLKQEAHELRSVLADEKAELLTAGTHAAAKKRLAEIHQEEEALAGGSTVEAASSTAPQVKRLIWKDGKLVPKE